MPAHHRRTLRQHFRSATPIILAAAAVTALIERAGFLDRFENMGVDALTSVASGTLPEHVVIVAINDDEYEHEFNGVSPLDPKKVWALIGDIARDKPQAIGVDIDTSPDGYHDLNVPEDWPPIVWSTHARWDEAAHQLRSIKRALGNRGPTRTSDLEGLADFPEDDDGVIRRSVAELEVAGAGRVPSFSRAMLVAACRNSCILCCDATQRSTEKPVRLNFTRQRFDFTPMPITPIEDLAEEDTRDPGRTHGPFSGKMALLGGAFEAGRDEHRTPLGTWQGIQIVAQSIESDLHGGGIHTLQEWAAIAVDIALGYSMVALNFFVFGHSSRAAALRNVLLADLVAVFVLPLAGSALTFFTAAFWFNFVPLLLSVLIHEFYEHAREYQRLVLEHGVEL